MRLLRIAMNKERQTKSGLNVDRWRDVCWAGEGWSGWDGADVGWALEREKKKSGRVWVGIYEKRGLCFLDTEWQMDVAVKKHTDLALRWCPSAVFAVLAHVQSVCPDSSPRASPLSDEKDRQRARVLTSMTVCKQICPNASSKMRGKSLV